jgi:receptor protein-tyrosine kinase
VKRLLLWAVAASLLVAVVVYTASALQTPTYEASVQMWVNFQKLDDLPTRAAGGVEGVQLLTQLMALAIDTRPNAKEAVRRLGLEMSPDELLSNLTVEPVEDTNLLRLTYEGTDPERAARIAGTLAEVASEQTVEESPRGGGSKLTVALYDKASVPNASASPKPLRNGLLALVAGLALSAALIGARRRVRLNEERAR